MPTGFVGNFGAAQNAGASAALQIKQRLAVPKGRKRDVGSNDKSRSAAAHITLGMKQKCPCCGYYTLRVRGGDEICQVCFWQDDGQDDAEADEVWGGPNGKLSLAQARRNFHAFGAVEERWIQNVRKPTPEELHA